VNQNMQSIKTSYIQKEPVFSRKATSNGVKDKISVIIMLIITLIFLKNIVFNLLTYQYIKNPELIPQKLKIQETNEISAKRIINGLEFPKEEGYHKDALVEWWYFSSQLQDSQNPKNLFGATVVFVKNKNNFDSHLIVVDISEQKRYSGRTRTPQNTVSCSKLLLKSGENYWIETELFNYKLHYNYQNVELDLILESLKNPVIIEDKILLKELLEEQDVWGLHLNQTRIKARGNLALENKKYDVIGTGWIYHRTFPRSFPEEIFGWKWWTVQLDNNVELMSRYAFCSQSVFSDLFIFEENSSGLNMERLDKTQYSLKELSYWEDFITPRFWLLEIPAKNVNLKISSLMQDQSLSEVMYEGICEVEGVYQGLEVRGQAHFEKKNRVKLGL